VNVYSGETVKSTGTRVKEHPKEVESITGAFTRAERTRATNVCNKSAIMDHLWNENHVTDWDNVTVID